MRYQSVTLVKLDPQPPHACHLKFDYGDCAVSVKMLPMGEVTQIGCTCNQSMRMTCTHEREVSSKLYFFKYYDPEFDGIIQQLKEKRTVPASGITTTPSHFKMTSSEILEDEIRKSWRHAYMGEEPKDLLGPAPDDPPALEEPNSVPKEPRLIKVVRREIEAHPKFENLPKGILFAWKFSIHDVNTEGSGMLVRLNRKWIRGIWRHLYLGEELEEAKLAAEFERQLHEHHNTGPASSDQDEEGGSQSEPRTSPKPGSKRSTDDRADQGRDPIDVKVPKHD